MTGVVSALALLLSNVKTICGARVCACGRSGVLLGVVTSEHVLELVHDERGMCLFVR